MARHAEGVRSAYRPAQEWDRCGGFCHLRAGIYRSATLLPSRRGRSAERPSDAPAVTARLLLEPLLTQRRSTTRSRTPGSSAYRRGPCSLPPQATTAASYLDVVSVAATRSDDLRAAFSNTNSDVEIAAPGVGILSTKRGGYFTLNGTSMATPHVAGAAADIRARMSGESAATARSLLDAAIDDLGLPGRDVEFGFGPLNLCKAAGASCTFTPGEN